MARRRSGHSDSNIRHRNGWRRSRVVAEVMASEDTCYLCGRPVDKAAPAGTPGAPEVDEDIPVSRGGSPFDRRNCHIAHRLCNGVKHNHSTAWARARLGHPDATATERVNIITTQTQPFE